MWDSLENWYIGYFSPRLGIWRSHSRRSNGLWVMATDVFAWLCHVLFLEHIYTHKSKLKTENQYIVRVLIVQILFDKNKNSNFYFLLFFRRIFLNSIFRCGQRNKNHFDDPKCCWWYCETVCKISLVFPPCTLVLQASLQIFWFKLILAWSHWLLASTISIYGNEIQLYLVNLSWVLIPNQDKVTYDHGFVMTQTMVYNCNTVCHQCW